MINREEAKAVFDAYTAEYDLQNPMIYHKAIHTMKVAEMAEEIAKSIRPDEESADFAWMLGLLHDIGRFEQVRRYGTFLDSVSVDHAEFGADLLFGQGLIEHFPIRSFPEGWMEMAEKAIRLHNKLVLPEELDRDTRLFSDILRDADKVDIFRVIEAMPLEKRLGTSNDLVKNDRGASPAVMDCVYGHRCVPREVRNTRLDICLSHGCMAFELVFDRSRELAREQGFLSRLFLNSDTAENPVWTGQEQEQLDILRKEIKKVWGFSLKITRINRLE